MHFSVLFTHCPACGSVRFIQNNEKSKRCESCGFVFYMNASAAVAAFIVNSQGELLVCVRGKNPAKGTWDLPGGFVDDNETAEAAMSREVEEELHAQVVEARYLFSLPNKYEYSGLQIPTLDMFFACKLEDISNLQPSDDVADCFFSPMDEVNPELFGLASIKKAVDMFINKNPQAPKGELD
jgi:NAD+ diphosphatase